MTPTLRQAKQDVAEQGQSLSCYGRNQHDWSEDIHPFHHHVNIDTLPNLEWFLVTVLLDGCANLLLGSGKNMLGTVVNLCAGGTNV